MPYGRHENTVQSRSVIQWEWRQNQRGARGYEVDGRAGRGLLVQSHDTCRHGNHLLDM